MDFDDNATCMTCMNVDMNIIIINTILLLVIDRRFQ
jgi:hypothetical protein